MGLCAGKGKPDGPVEKGGQKQKKGIGDLAVEIKDEAGDQENMVFRLTGCQIIEKQGQREKNKEKDGT